MQGFENHGGELLPGSPVTQIKKKNRIFEIEINHSQHIFSHQLISNIDPRLIFNQLLAEPQVNDKYLQKMNAMKESCSTIGLLLATDIGLGPGIGVQRGSTRGDKRCSCSYTIR